MLAFGRPAAAMAGQQRALVRLGLHSAHLIGSRPRPSPTAAGSPSFTASIVAGVFAERGHAGDGGPATAALIDNPFGVVRGPDGALYFCEYDGECVRRVADDGTISTIAVRNPTAPRTPPTPSVPEQLAPRGRAVAGPAAAATAAPPSTPSSTNPTRSASTPPATSSSSSATATASARST